MGVSRFPTARPDLTFRHRQSFMVVDSAMVLPRTLATFTAHVYIAQVEVYTVISFARLQLQHFAVELEQLKEKKQAGTFESADLSFVNATVKLCSETIDAVKATTARMKPLLPKRETPIKDGPEV